MGTRFYNFPYAQGKRYCADKQVPLRKPMFTNKSTLTGDSYVLLLVREAGLVILYWLWSV